MGQVGQHQQQLLWVAAINQRQNRGVQHEDDFGKIWGGGQEDRLTENDEAQEPQEEEQHCHQQKDRKEENCWKTCLPATACTSLRYLQRTQQQPRLTGGPQNLYQRFSAGFRRGRGGASWQEQHVPESGDDILWQLKAGEGAGWNDRGLSAASAPVR